jgi:hypothetical protein
VEILILIRKVIPEEETVTLILINSVLPEILVLFPLLLISLATAKMLCMKLLPVLVLFILILKGQNKYAEGLISSSMAATAALRQTILNPQ